jgi:2-polyprenyl-3-methyl-5-hydroxy-6-metoxy-1,4-benzoquinol methylase
MTEQVTNCPLCGKTGSRPFDQRVFHGLPVVNRICAACGFVFQSPRMTEAELQEFYAAEYRRLYQGSEGPSAKDLAVQTQRADALLDFTRPYLSGAAALSEDSLFLDIGCSAGKLLESFARAYHCRVVGVEPGDAYRAEDQRRGLDVYASLDGVEQAGQYPCDLISLIHVLEHLPDPVQYLAHLRQKLLKPDGALLIEVPNLYAHDSFEVAHLASFSAHTLVETLKQAGFELVALRKHGAPRSRLLPLYITVLARPLPVSLLQAVAPERGVQLKRRVGMFRRRIVTRLFPGQAWLPLAVTPIP